MNSKTIIITLKINKFHDGKIESVETALIASVTGDDLFSDDVPGAAKRGVKCV